ncbi:DNA methylase [Porphyromonas gingivalis]|uniref:DNA methylase n=1 Tax=Porphyromonas gingivalis TaxID=837 RepID=UPI001F1BC8B3
MYNYFHSLLPPLSLAPFLRRTPLPSTSLFFKGLLYINGKRFIYKSKTIYI